MEAQCYDDTMERDITLYQDALSCMQLISNNVSVNSMDFPYLEELCQSVSSAIFNLRMSSKNAFFSESLECLLETLLLHQGVLKSLKENQKEQTSFCTEYDRSDNSTMLQNRYSAIEDMKLPMESVGVAGFSDVIGLNDAKQILNEACILPAQFPHLFTGAAKPWSRILFYGPPGTGKTRLAKALAAELKCSFYCVSSAAILSSWVGESEKMIRELFQSARGEGGQCVIFFDEIDSVCRQRTQSEDEHSRRVKTELLRQLDESPEEENRILVLAASNCPWDMDLAFLRRFQQRILIRIPEYENRSAILTSAFSGANINMNEDDWNKVNTLTGGFSGADLSHLARAAAFMPIRELHSARFWKFTKDSKIVPCSNDTMGAMQYTLDKLPSDRVIARPVELQDFIKALKTTTKTITQDLLQKYEEFSNGTKPKV